MKKKIAIIDYGMGNTFSIQCALKNVGLDSIVTSKKKQILNSDAIILPGVGAFPKAMEKIRINNLDNIILKAHKSNKIIIGICLGMQLLFEKSYENSLTKGLGILKGKVIYFKKNNKIKNKFNVGWNKIVLNHKNKDRNLKNLNKKYMYFIHSCYVKVGEKNIETSFSRFNSKIFTSSVRKNNVYAYQFHPEKSAENGINMYKSIKNILSS
ncbi:imidazole glycerol phosphate synthase subunit HisH [Candidatus Pelagibacter sp.]|uniref:imidazole glycerol phosphate synthase subunit HisH n=1 Tax=Candidatus Pelagibacter sp. TaxID=2024849 RepID=UPI003F8385F5